MDTVQFDADTGRLKAISDCPFTDVVNTTDPEGEF